MCRRSKRHTTDFPPSGLATNGTPTGGWWNYSGLQREVYLKRLDTVDWKSVRVIPRIACGSCSASVQVKVILRNEGERGFTVEPGDRIAQLLLIAYAAPALELVEELPASDRGSAGFGSSGR